MHTDILKVLFIINPILEKKNGKKLHALLAGHLDSNRFEMEIVRPGTAELAGELARENLGKYDIMVAGGGDGTINRVAGHLVHSDTALGILPMGSGNGLARSLGIPMDIGKAIRLINRLPVTRIDTGLINRHRFINIAGIGFAARVAHLYAGGRTRGFIPYAVKSAGAFPGYSSFPASIEIDDKQVSGRFFLISIANSSQWGYGAYISPMSDPADGFLDICLLRSFPKILVPGLMTRLFTKTFHKSRYTLIIPVKNAEISGSDRFTGHVDGEPVVFDAPLHISVEPGSLKVICPEERTVKSG